MRLQKRIAALILTICLAFAMSMTAFAHEVPDSSKTGSVSVSMIYNEEAVPGGELSLYRVGEVYEDDGSYFFALTGDFAGSGISLDDIASSALASGLAAWVSDNSLSALASVTVGDDGIAVFSGLEIGLYLVVQTKAADGYGAVSPFVVSVPANEDGTYIYDVDATPKMSALTEGTPDDGTDTDGGTGADGGTDTDGGTGAGGIVTGNTGPGGTGTGSTGTGSTGAGSSGATGGTGPSSASTLPQTGQLNWPVPALAVAGLCLILTGFALRSGRKELPYEV